MRPHTQAKDTPERNVWHVIGLGLAGWHAKGINISSSGGHIVDRPWWAGGTQYGYLTGAIEGALVYDASESDAAAFAKLIISGPMCDPSLAPEGVNRFNDRYTIGTMRVGLSGEFAELATLAQDEQYSGLDYVGVAIYRRLLATVPGIKIGTVHAGAIVWES